jgi:hypothetical protein
MLVLCLKVRFPTTDINIASSAGYYRDLVLVRGRVVNVGGCVGTDRVIVVLVEVWMVVGRVLEVRVVVGRVLDVLVEVGRVLDVRVDV